MKPLALTSLLFVDILSTLQIPAVAVAMMTPLSTKSALPPLNLPMVRVDRNLPMPPASSDALYHCSAAPPSVSSCTQPVATVLYFWLHVYVVLVLSHGTTHCTVAFLWWWSDDHWDWMCECVQAGDQMVVAGGMQACKRRLRDWIIGIHSTECAWENCCHCNHSTEIHL